MNVSLRWLREIAPDVADRPEVLADRLAALGFPVEELHSLGSGLDDIVVARVEAVRPHPNADRLRLCEVDAGTGAGTVQVVCGADNVAAGGRYPFAPVGATLPGGMRIGKARLRGEVSEGMLCSESELGLGPGHAGLLELPEGLAPGRRFVEALALDDVRMSVEVTSNRPDLLSQVGIARELSPGGHAALRLPDFPGVEPGGDPRIEAIDRAAGSERAEGDGITVRIEDPDLCARYLALAVRGVQVGPSPEWLQARLRAVGARPINNVVDATNYVLLELGQPLHAFDLAKVREETVVVRRARDGESIRTLDGVHRRLTPGMLAICDPSGPMAVAGVMGGEDSEVSEQTSDVLLECALFTPGPIRATRKELGLSTDASYRFERGVDPEGMVSALLRAAALILATAGGTVGGAIVDANPAPFTRTQVRLRRDRVGKVLGIPFTLEEISDLLLPLGLQVEVDEAAIDGEGGTLEVEVPGFRSRDLTREVDLIEEVARRHGFDRFPETLGAFRPGTVPDHPLFHLEAELRSELAAWGAFEAQTPAFAPEGEGDVELLNPISAEEGFLRARLLPGLVRRLEYNLARGNRNVRLFEIGTVFAARGEGELPTEETRLAAVLHGEREPPHWTGSTGAIDLWDLKGLMERLARRLPEGAQVIPVPQGSDDGLGVGELDPGRCFRILSGEGELVGAGGRLRDGAADLPPWADEVFLIEIILPAESASEGGIVYAPIPSQPGVDRDLALLVPDTIPVGDVLSVVGRSGGPELRDVRVFDVYREPGGEEKARSVAVRMHFRSPDRTLTDREVEGAVKSVLNTLQEELGVGVRGSQG